MPLKVIVGSSSEFKDYARWLAVRANAERPQFADLSVWDDLFFFPAGQSLIPEFLEKLDSCDYTVFLLTADDITHSRGRKRYSPRDNIIFEFGMSIARIGLSRTILLVQQAEGVTQRDGEKIPPGVMLLSDYLETYIPFSVEHMDDAWFLVKGHIERVEYEKQHSNKEAASDKEFVKLLGLSYEERTTLVLPGIQNDRKPRFRNPDGSGSLVQARNYPQSPFDIGCDDQYCAMHIFPFLKSVSEPYSVKVVYAEDFEPNTYTVNHVFIGSPYSNSGTRAIIQSVDLFYDYTGRAIVGDGEEYSAQVKHEGGTFYTLKKDYALLSVFKKEHTRIVVLSGCRAYGQIACASISMNGELVRELLTRTNGKFFQCIFPVDVTNRNVYRMSGSPKLAVKEHGVWQRVQLDCMLG